MRPTSKNINAAAKAGIISSAQAQQLIQFIEQEENKSYSFSHLLFFLGAIVLLSGVILLIKLNWQNYGNLGLLCTTSGFLITAIISLYYFHKYNLLIPAALCASLIIFITPFFLHSCSLEIWPPTNKNFRINFTLDNLHWLSIEIITLLTGLCLYRKYSYSFIFFPIGVTLWFITLSGAGWIEAMYPGLHILTLCMIVSGLLILAIAYIWERYYKQNLQENFWLYGSGVSLLWCGMNFQQQPTELKQFSAMLISVIFLKLGQYLKRNVFYIFGALGIIFYVVHLAYSFLNHQLDIIIMLIYIGFLCLVAGVFCQHNKKPK